MLDRLSQPMNSLTIFIGELFSVNLLIFLVNIPFVFSLLFLPKTPVNLLWIILTGIPLGPAITAALATLTKFMHDRTFTVWRPFWHFYRLGFGQSLLTSTVMCVVSGVLVFNLAGMLANGRMILLFYPTLLVLLLLPLLFANSLLLTSRFNFSNKLLIRNTIAFIASYPKVAISNWAWIVAFYGILIATRWPLLLLLMFSAPLYLVLVNFKKVLAELTSEQGDMNHAHSSR